MNLTSIKKLLAIGTLSITALAFSAMPLLAEMKLSGSVGVGFGQVSTDDGTTTNSSLDAVGEASVNFSAKKGAFSGQIEMGIAEDSAQALDTAEHELVWSPSESLSVTISGYSFGIASADGNISVISAPTGQVGDEEVYFDYSDAGLFNVEYKVGDIITLGAGISEACVPQCGYAGTDGGGAMVMPDGELSTMVLHGRGKAGPVGYNVYYAASSGSYSPAITGDVALSGSGGGYGLGLKYEGGGLTVGFDYSSAVVTCLTDALAVGTTVTATCVDDIEQSKMGVALTVAGVGVHYYKGEESTGTATDETANIDVVYLIEMDGATIGPEYRTTTVTLADGSETTNSFLLFGMAMEF